MSFIVFISHSHKQMTANINCTVLLEHFWVNKIRHPCQCTVHSQPNETHSTTAWIPAHFRTVITPSLLFWSCIRCRNRRSSQTHAFFDIISILSNPILIHYKTLISVGGSETWRGSPHRARRGADYSLYCGGSSNERKTEQHLSQ